MKILLFLTFFSQILWASVAPKVAGVDLVSGKNITYSWDSSHNGTVVIFLSSTCPCSNQNIPYLKNLSAKWKDYTFLGVHSNVDEDPLSALDYFAEKNLPFPVLQDKKAHLADEFKALKTPHAYIVSPEGKILYQGGVTDSANPEKAEKHFLDNALKALNKKQIIIEKVTRVLGCEITRE
jgi:hypothetical protein